MGSALRLRWRVGVCALLFLLSCPAWATWTLVQVKDVNPNGGNCNSCSVALTATTAGNLLVAGLIQGNASSSISSVTGACSATWTHVPSSNAGVSGDGWVDLYYCTNATGGSTSVAITAAVGCANSCIGIVWEAHSTAGSIALDSGATPSGSGVSTSGTSVAGISLTLSGNNDFIVGLASCGDTCNGLTGTGCTNDVANPSGDGTGHCISSGSATYPATWTQSTSATVARDAAAFQEAGGGGGGTNKNSTLPTLGVGQ